MFPFSFLRIDSPLCARVFLIFANIFILGLAGCPAGHSSEHIPPQVKHISDSIQWSQDQFPISLDEQQTAHVNFHLAAPKSARSAPAILFLPGAGAVSRFGTRQDNGLTSYAEPIDVNVLLMVEAAQHGFMAMAYDKRSCGPNDDQRCNNNHHGDIDRLGPQALAKDVDHACAVLENHPQTNGQLILWAHGQSGQVALASNCIKRAQALVMVAPIPRRVDRVMVDALYARANTHFGRAKTLAKDPSQSKAELHSRRQGLALKNKASSLGETFTALSDNRFPEDATIWGVDASFWTNWIQLTDRLPGERPSPQIPWLIALGDRDGQFAPQDRKRIQSWATDPSIQVYALADLDHHLITNGRLGNGQIRPIFEELIHLLGQGPS